MTNLLLTDCDKHAPLEISTTCGGLQWEAYTNAFIMALFEIAKHFSCQCVRSTLLYQSKMEGEREKKKRNAENRDGA